jgi:hypothetical protein
MRYRIVIHSLKPPWRQKNNGAHYRYYFRCSAVFRAIEIVWLKTNARWEFPT